MFDKFRDECGVFGIYGHAEAAKMAYLGLYALQHRGQESAGIAVSDGLRVRALRPDGYVAEIFTQPALATLPGHVAIGHTRYSTAGESTIANAQPLLIDCVHGQVGICHNGNIVNAREIRDELVRQGSIFQTNSDTEVVLHLFARSQAGGVDDALVESIARLTGAFSFAFITRTGWWRRAIRTASGRWRSAGSAMRGSCARRPARWTSSGATYVRDVEPGEVLIIGPDGPRSVQAVSSGAERALHLRARLFRPARQRGVRQERQRRAHQPGPRSWRAKPAWRPTSSCPSPTRASARPSATRKQAGLPMRMGLIRNHYVGRTFIEPAQSIRHFGVKVKLNPVRSLLAGPAGDPHRRLDRARHDQPEDREDGARRRRRRGARAHQLPAHDLARASTASTRRSAASSSPPPIRSRRSASTSRPTRWPT